MRLTYFVLVIVYLFVLKQCCRLRISLSWIVLFIVYTEIIYITLDDSM